MGTKRNSGIIKTVNSKHADNEGRLYFNVDDSESKNHIKKNKDEGTFDVIYERALKVFSRLKLRIENSL